MWNTLSRLSSIRAKNVSTIRVLGAAASLLILSEVVRKDDEKKDIEESSWLSSTRDDNTIKSCSIWRLQPNPSSLIPLLSPLPDRRTRCDVAFEPRLGNAQISKRSTIQMMKNSSTLESLESKYNVQWDKVLGRGAYGNVYLATNRETKEQVAVKKISKKYTGSIDFQREMNALLHLNSAGGHPNICSLHEHFDEGNFYYVVIDFISGGEMFDFLVSEGAFSEHDASRLVREVASALAFIHGLDTVHFDLKPENLMLSTKNPKSAVVKLVDFGCAQVTAPDSPYSEGKDAVRTDVAATPAYCPPEVLEKLMEKKRPKSIKLEPTMDMWSLGVILYIMLTGLHPFDLSNADNDDEVKKAIISRKPPPLRNSPITAHLSDSAIDIIEKLLKPSPKKRITALEMLEHPWVKGETASRKKIADSDKKLSMRFQSKVFETIVDWSDQDMDEVARKSSLIERVYGEFFPSDSSEKGGDGFKPGAPLSLSGVSDLLSENMKNKYFPKGHVVYKEGEIGNHLYFINSGIIEVTTKEGSHATRGPGNFFGEGALLHPKKIRSGTIRCKTPVHAMQISREYFEKYLAGSDAGLLLTLKEKDKIRKRNRAKTILRLQKDLVEKTFEKGENLFEAGESDDCLYLVESGLVDMLVDGKRVFTATPGNICGEYS